MQVAGLVGGVGLLKAVGFRKVGTSLELSEADRDLDLLRDTRAKLEAAIAQNS